MTSSRSCWTWRRLRPGQDTLDLGDVADLGARAPRMQDTADFTAVGRDLQERDGISLKKIIQILSEARSAVIETDGRLLTLDPKPTPAAQELLQRLRTGH
jgi:hypothetical protein